MASIVDARVSRELESELALLESARAPAAEQERAGGLFNPRHLLALLRANALLIAAIVLASLAVALVATLLTTPRYTATTSFQINEQADRVLKEGDDTLSQTDLYDTDRFIQTQIDILRSRGLAQRVAQSLRLTTDASFYRGMGVEPPGPNVPANIVREMTYGMLAGNLSIDLPRSSRIVQLRFTSNDPQLSARIANAYVREFIAANLQRKFDSSAYARSFVSDQLAEVKARLEASERAVNDYARRAGLFRMREPATGGGESAEGGSTSIVDSSLMQLNRAANEARAQRLAAEGRWRVVAAGNALSQPEVLANGSVQALLTQRAEVQTKLQLDRARHLPDHPSVIQLSAQAAEIDRQLNAVIANVRASLKAQYDAALAAEQRLDSQVNQLKTASLSEQDSAVQYNILTREADTNRILYDGLLQRFKELNAAAGLSASNIAVIDAADPPLGPSSPNLFANLFLGLVIGGAVAGLLVLARDQFDDAIRVPEDIEQKLQLPLLGVIPHSPEDPELALADPKSAVSESYNSLGGTLLYSTPQGLPRVILVTSAQPTEGKSTTSFAIASGLARIGRQVVLVDVDLRRPSLHRRSGTDNKRGMTTLLTSDATVASVAVPGQLPGLSLITSGPVPPSPSELIASPRMHTLIDELAEQYDVVVIDSPPILGLADAPLLAPLADGVMMVIEADRGRRGTLKTALRRLRAMRPVILGAVLTKFDARKNANSYSDYYGQNYYEYRADDGQPTRRARWF